MSKPTLPNTRPSRLSHALMVATCLNFGAGIALAQAESGTTYQQAVHEFNIPAGALATALSQFAQTAAINLNYDPALLSGKTSQGLQGRFSVEEGLNQLLAHSALQASPRSGGYQLEPAPVSGAALDLPVVVVTGDRLGMTTEGTGSYTTSSTSTATGMNLSLRETPQSVTVVTRQRMDDQALNSLGTVLDQTPGVSHSSGTDYAGYTYTYSRGYRIANFDVDGMPGTGGMSVGGLGGWYDVSSLETAIYDSVTIVRGATGLLQGTGDPSGSIGLTRKRPTEEFQASIEAGVGRWDKRRTVGDVSGPLNQSGTLRGRLVAVYDEGESWKDRYQGDRSVVYGVIETDVTDDTLFRLTVDHQNIDSTGDAQGTFFPILMSDGSRSPFSKSDNATTDWTRFQRESTNISARLEHQINDNWQAMLNYSRLWGENEGVFGNIAMGLEPDGRGWMHLRNYSNDQDWEGISLKLSGNYTLFGRSHDLVVGVNRDRIQLDTFFIRDMSQTGSWIDWKGHFPEPDWSSYTASLTELETKQNGLYLATRLHATDDLSFLVGARLSDWETRTKDRRSHAVTDSRKESGVFTPYAAVVYDLTSSLSAYASYTEIFNPQNFRDVNNSILDPEEGSNVELGLKGEWFAGRLNASAAIFQSGKDNLAVRDGDRLTPEGDFAYVAADDTEGRGWELEVSGELAPGWHVQGGYTRMVLKDSDGQRLATEHQPKHMFKLFSSWTPSQLNRLTVGGGLRWQSETYDASNPALRSVHTQDSYTVVDLMTRYVFDDHLSLAVNLNNAFDKAYRHNLVAYHYYGPPRNLQATLKYQF